MELYDKVAVVTGVSKGIGRAVVEVLLKESCVVIGWGRSAPEFKHHNFHFVKTDVRNIDSVNNAYQATTRIAGKNISILINNAGLGYESNFEDLAPEKWHAMFDTNVNGIFYCSRLVVPDMKKNETGHIINIASIAGTTGIPGMAAYCGTKHAVRGISHSMYKELRKFGIKVTTIYPGSVNTNFFDDIDSVEANKNMMRPEDIADSILHCLKSHSNYHQVDLEVRPLRPKG